MVNRVVVGAHYGLRDWLLQRVTAVIMVLYTIFLAILVFSVPSDHGSWKSLFQMQWVRLFSFVTFLALFMHAWVGIRDVLMDYLQDVGVRLVLQVLVIAALVMYTAWAIQILWGI